MRFNPYFTEYYRESTKTVTKQPGIMSPKHTCSKCRTTTAKMLKQAGTGTSRHNPIVWICITCSEK